MNRHFAIGEPVPAAGDAVTVDHPDIAETLVDGLLQAQILNGLLRLTFFVERVAIDQKNPEKHVALRIALTPASARATAERLIAIAEKLEEAEINTSPIRTEGE
jgi:hypothetical protein